MKAAVLVPGCDKLLLEEVTPAVVGPRDVLIEVESSGICGTDVSAFRSRTAGYATEPKILGHEGAGRVVEVGAGVHRCRVGDRVIAAFVPACGECWFCLRGLSNYCERNAANSSAHQVRRADGTSAATMSGLGTFAERMTVHEDAVVAVDTDLPSDQLALIGCGVATGIGAVLWTAEVKPGSSVAIFGLGGVGQFVVQGARIAGAARIIVVDPVAHKRAHAEAAGATDVVDPMVAEPVEQIREATGGRGADYVFEVVGNPSIVLSAYASARRGGTIVLLGKPPSDATVALPVDTMFRSGKRLVGSLYGSVRIREHFPLLVNLAERGLLDIGSAITRRISLDEVNEGLHAVESGEVIRVVIC